MPVVLQSDLDNLLQSKVDDFKAALGNPFGSTSNTTDQTGSAPSSATATAPPPVADNADRDAAGTVQGPPSPPPDPSAADVSPSPDTSTQSTPPPSSNGQTIVPGVPDWLTNLISSNAPDQLKNDPQFIQTVAAGAKGESGWDVNSIQHGYTLGDGKGARGLFQFDMGGMGAGHNETSLLGMDGAQLQAAQIVPIYAKNYLNAPADLTGAARASWVAGNSEHPYDYANPNSVARVGYTQAFQAISGGGSVDNTPPPGTSAGAPPDTTTLALPTAQPVTPAPASTNPLQAAAALKDQLGNPFQSAANAVGATAQNAVQAAQNLKDTLGNPFQSAQQGATDLTTDIANGAGTALNNGLAAANLQDANPAVASASVAPGGDQANALGNAINGPSAAGQPTPLQNFGGQVSALGQNISSGDQIPGAPGASNLIGAGVQAAGGLLSAPPIDQQSPQQMVMGIAGDAGGSFDKYGVETGFVPPDAKPGAASYPDYPAPPPQPATPPTQDISDALQGLVNMLRQRPDADQSTLDTVQASLDSAKAKTAPPPTTDVAPAAPAAAPTAPSDTAPAVDTSTTVPVDTGVPAPPPERYDPESGEWVSDPTASVPVSNGHVVVNPDGSVSTGDTTIGAKAGPSYPYNKADTQVPGLHFDPTTNGWVDGNGAPVDLTALGDARPSRAASKGAPDLPSKIASETQVAAGVDPGIQPTQDLPRNITPEMAQAAHEQLNNIPGNADEAHVQLDTLLANNADPRQLSQFMNQQTGNNLNPTDWIRALRTGAMAGGDTSEFKVIMNPIIQTVMNGFTDTMKDVVTGHPSQAAAGIRGGIQGAAAGAYDGLQILRYGVSDRAALTGSAGGAFGFKPGPDVLGGNALQRAAGTALIGAVRTHGAAAEVAAGMARGAALAKGADTAAANEAGQQAALRSSNYGSIGTWAGKALDQLKGQNPALDVAGQILNMFYKVSYNTLRYGTEFSPVGGVGTALDVARAKLPSSAPSWLSGPYAVGNDASHVTPHGQRIARNMFGTGLATLGLAAAANGDITGANPQNGQPKWSVKTPAGWMPLRFLGIGGEALAQSAILAETARDGSGDVGKMAQLSAAAYISHLNDESFLRGLGDIIIPLAETRDIPAGGARATQAINDIKYTVGNQAQSFLPQSKLIGNIASTLNGFTAPASGSVPAAPAKRPAAPEKRPTAPTRPSRPTRPRP